MGGKVEYHDPFDGKLGFALSSRHNGLIHVSGMTGFEPDMSVPDGIEAQMRLAYGNIVGILEHHGASLADAVEQVVFFVGEATPAVAAFNRVSRDFFGKTPPPCTMIGATALVDPRYLVEIKVTAVDPKSA
jgi:enamine deaminase RidA (YjgF/YER057c/UK114 family)